MNWQENAPVLCELHRSASPLNSKVPCDNATALVEKCFDYKFTGESKIYPFEIPEEILNLDVNIIQIVGPSGSGKSTFLRAFEKAGWHMPRKVYDNSKALISNFLPDAKGGMYALNSVGLSSMPLWVRPRNVLSMGEGFRADLAYNLESKVMIDEYTSVIDRWVARSTSNGVQSYIRKMGLKGVILCGCHYDVIDYVQPDILIDLTSEKVYDLRDASLRAKLFKNKIDFTIEKVPANKKAEVWKIFAPHHYLNSELNMAAECWVAKWEGTMVGFCAVLPQPTGTANYCKRVSRLVVLPDFQGLKIGTRFLDAICEMYLKHGYKMYIRSAHAKLAYYWKKSPWWRATASNEKKSAFSNGDINGANMNPYVANRECYSYEYVGHDYVEKQEHMNLVVDSLKNIDKNAMRKFLMDAMSDKYVTIIHNKVQNESWLNLMCKEMGIRTELLYIHNKLSKKHIGEKMLVSLKPGKKPIYKNVA